MSKSSVFLFLSIMFSGFVSQSAILVSGDLSEEEQENVDNVLRTYTGLSPKCFENNLKESTEHHVLLTENIPYAEVGFLKDYFQKQGLNVSVAYVPSIIWDLHVISKYLTDEETKASYQKIAEPFNYRAHRERYFALSKELMNKLAPEDSRDIKYFKLLANSYLKTINTDKTTDNVWSQGLMKELETIEKNSPSILHQMIAEEMEANEKNKILLVRATNCIKYHAVSMDEKALDFPLEGRSIEQAIDNFQKEISKSLFKLSKDFSYADSLLAGYLFDSFNKSVSASPFVFFRHSSAAIYTLHLDKKWLFSKGRPMFYLPTLDYCEEGAPLPSLETDSIFGRGEYFHPRLRGLVASSKASKPSHNIEDMPHDFVQSNCFEIDPDFICQKEGELTKQEEENIKISQYLFTVNDLLSQARVIAYNGEIVDPHDYPQSVKSILENQKKASELLKKKTMEVL